MEDISSKSGEILGQKLEKDIADIQTAIAKNNKSGLFAKVSKWLKSIKISCKFTFSKEKKELCIKSKELIKKQTSEETFESKATFLLEYIDNLVGKSSPEVLKKAKEVETELTEKAKSRKLEGEDGLKARVEAILKNTIFVGSDVVTQSNVGYNSIH